MDQYVKDNLKKNKKEIDDLKNDTQMDKDIKEKLMSILQKEKGMLKKIEKHYKENGDK